MQKSTRIIAGFLVIMFIISLSACSSSNGKTVFEKIQESPAAKMELPDGSSFIVDSEILSLRSFADLNIQLSSLEPADSEEDWLYRIIFNPSEKVLGTDEIIVSFHKDYLQINTEYYLPADGVSYESILEWAEGKFDHFMK